MARQQDRRLSPMFVPRYSILDAVASLDVPPYIRDWEATDNFVQRCEDRARILIEEVRRLGKAELAGLFHTNILPDRQGIITIHTRSGTPVPCAVFFSSAFRAAEYSDLLLCGVKLQHVAYIADEFVNSLRVLEGVGTRHFVIDRCPRCWTFAPTPSAGIRTRDDALNAWCAVKSTELTKADFYYNYATHLASSGDLIAARDVALTAIAHVTAEDPRFHALLADLGERLRDHVLETEAREAVIHIKAVAVQGGLGRSPQFKLLDLASRA